MVASKRTIRQAQERRKLENYRKRAENLDKEYSSWRAHYTEISEFMAVRKARFLIDKNRTSTGSDGARVDQCINNSYPIDAVGIAAAGMQAGITPQARPFMKCTINDKGLADYGPVKEWLHYATDIVLKIYSLNNFYQSMHQYWRSALTFGIANSVQIEDFETVSHFRNFEVGEYMLARGINGRHNASYRKFSMTAYNIVEEFGKENCSKSIVDAVDGSDGDKRFLIWHVIQPNKFFEKGNIGIDGKKWESIYFEDKGEDDKFLKIEGFASKPFSSLTWDPDGNSAYGNCPGMTALGDCKMLQTMEAWNAEGVDLAMHPSFQAPSTIKSEGLNLDPNGVTWLPDDKNIRGVEPIIKYMPDLKGMSAQMQRIEERIGRVFFVQLFLSLINETDSRKTAYEIAEKQREKMLILGPVIESATINLREIVLRTLDILNYFGELPPMPPEMRGKLLDVEVLGTLAQAQRMVGIEAIGQLTQFVGNMGNIDPNLKFMLDGEECIREVGKRLGTPPSLLRDQKIVQQLIKFNQQREQQIAMLQGGEKAAKMAKDMAQAPVGSSNALNQLLLQSGANIQ